MIKSLLLASVSALLLTVTTQTGCATVLVYSTFEASELGAEGRRTVVTTNNSNLTPWYIANSGGATNLVVDNDTEAGGLGKSLKLGPSYFALTSFTPASLAVGETLSLTMNYRFSSAPGASAENLRIAFYSSGLTSPLASDTSSMTGLSEYTGYFAGIAAGGPAGISASTTFRERLKDTTAALNSQSTGATIRTTTGGFESGTTAHNLVFNITRGETSSLITLEIDGQTLLSYTDETTPYHLFNSLMIANQAGTDRILYMDNIKVEVIPEGQTVALTLLGAGILFAGLRGRTLLCSSSSH